MQTAGKKDLNIQIKVFGRKIFWVFIELNMDKQTRIFKYLDICFAG